MPEATLAQLRHRIELSETGTRAALDRLGILGDDDSLANARDALAAHRGTLKAITAELEGFLRTVQASSAAMDAQWRQVRTNLKEVP